MTSTKRTRQSRVQPNPADNMESISLTVARENLSSIMDQVCVSRKPVTVHRRNGKSVVLIPLDEYCENAETNYLLGNRKNALRLLQGIAELEGEK